MNLSCAQQAKGNNSFVHGEHAPSAQRAGQPDQSWDSMMRTKEGCDELLSQVDLENVQPPDIP